MRVGFSLASLVPGRVGGSETYAAALLAALGDEPGVEVTALVPPAAQARYAGRVVRHGIAAEGPARAAGLLAGLALGGIRGRRLGRFDVVHHPFTVPVLRPPGPQVITLHDVAHHDVPELFGAAERRFRAVAYDAPARRAAAVVCPSEHARSRIAERLGVRATVIPHGIDHERFRPDPDEARRPDLPERYVVFPANLWPHKNHERLVRAMELVADRDLALVLTGALDDARWAAIRTRRVVHLGRVADDELPCVLRGARALVMPSLYEGFGAPVLEAMACGVPVACSDRGALPEVAGGAAELFDALDETAIAAAIDRVTGDEPHRERLVAAGLQHAAGRTWQASAQAHASLWRSLG